MLGGEEEKDPDAQKKEEERQEALRQQEEERKAKHARMEAEREKVRQQIRDKVSIPCKPHLGLPCTPDLTLDPILPESHSFSPCFLFPEMEVAGPGLLWRGERSQAGPLVQLTNQVNTCSWLQKIRGALR